MNGELRRAVFALGFFRHLQPRGFVAGVPNAADAMGRPRGGLFEHGNHTKAIERTHGIRRQVDIGADTPVIDCLLVNLGVVAGLTQRDSRRHAANATAGDADFQSRHGQLEYLVFNARRNRRRRRASGR